MCKVVRQPNRQNELFKQHQNIICNLCKFLRQLMMVYTINKVNFDYQIDKKLHLQIVGKLKLQHIHLQ